MRTPICDFVEQYRNQDALRFHMPGHKGAPLLGWEPWDITEIPGADSLYQADGIIFESERNAGRLFGARTFYATEGSSQVIRAMVSLAVRYAAQQGRQPLIWAARNAHSAFLSALALMDCPVEWLYSQQESSYLSCALDAVALERKLSKADERPIAVYVTSPDYLGNLQDIAALAQACHAHGVLLLVDNAHGAYLKFLPQSMHPMDLGADMCSDSAHKTLPVLTGGAYLHLSLHGPAFDAATVREALRLFGSTSPSYLILQSLDRANPCLSETFGDWLKRLGSRVDELKRKLAAHGYSLIGTEPMKLTLCAKAYGYRGEDFAQLLAARNMMVEFADPDFVVFMLSPFLQAGGIDRLERLLLSIPRKQPVPDCAPRFVPPPRVMNVRQAMLAPSVLLPVVQCCGRILSQATVACPPAVPIVVSGERIDQAAIRCFEYFGVERCRVVEHL